MSVHPHGKGYQVKWRDLDGNQHGETFARKGDADHFDREIKRAKALGPVIYQQLIDAHGGGLTLRAFVAGEFKEHLNAVDRSRKTRDQYQWALNNHLAELASESLHALDVRRLKRHQSFLLEHGRSVHTTRTAMTLLGGILQIAVEHGHITGNPVHAMTKVKAKAKADVRPLAPVQVESLIAASDGRDRIVAILGGRCGLRPIEIRLAECGGIGDGTLRVGPDETKQTAVENGSRTIALDSDTERELKLWKLRTGGRDEDPIVGVWTEDAMKAWWQRFARAVAREATGRADVTLYALRHSHASALHYIEGMTVPAAARRMGHGPSLHLRTYAKVIEAMEGRPAKYADLDDVVRCAQVELAGGWSPQVERATG